MLVIDKKILMFNIKEVYFSDCPVDIEDCDFIRFRYCKDKVDVKGFNRHESITSVIDLTQDLETIWQKMDKKSTRYGINRAQRENIEVFIGENHEIFFQMYKSFLNKKGIRSKFEIFGVGSVTLDAIKKYGTLFIAKYNDEILAGTVYLEDNSNLLAWLGFSKRFEKDKRRRMMAACANRLIDWEAIKYAKEKGIKQFNLGGLWSEEEANKDLSKKGINTFKLSFGGEILTCYSYIGIYSKIFKTLYNSYNIIKKLK